MPVLVVADDLCWSTGARTPDVNFPTKTSYFLSVGGITTAVLPDGGLACRGKGKVSVSEDKIWAMITTNSEFNGNVSYLTHSEDPSYKIKYQVYYDKSLDTPANFGQRQLAFKGNWFEIIQGGQTQIAPLYFRIFPERNIRYLSGRYTARIVNNWSWKVCKRSIGACVSWEEVEPGAVVAVTDINIQVLGDCVIRSDQDTLNFGTKPFVQDFDPVANTITVNCTSDIKDYSVGVSMGKYADGGIRNMKSDSGENIAYQIYKGNSKEVWAGYHEPKDSANRRSKNEADYQNENGQVFRYSAEILSGQTPKPEGDYEDEVIIDFAF